MKGKKTVFELLLGDFKFPRLTAQQKHEIDQLNKIKNFARAKRGKFVFVLPWEKK